MAEKEYDLDNMTLEEADAALREITEGIESDPVEDEVEPEPEQPVEEPAVEEPEQEEEPVAAEEANGELPDERDLLVEEMKLKLEAERQARERFELAAGRSGGELGHLRKEFDRLKAQLASNRPEVDDLDYEQPAESPRRVQPQPNQPQSSHLEDQVAELRQEATKVAVEKVYSDFLSQVQDDLKAQGVEQDKLASEQEAVFREITPTLQGQIESFGDLSNAGTKTLQKVTKMALQGAYTDYRLKKIASLRNEISERKASQVAQSKIAKQAASPSGSGGKSVKEPPPKKPEEMTADEADAALIELFGDGHGRVRPRR